MTRPRGEDLTRFAELSYDDFRRLAVDPALSDHERIGFPVSYREGFEAAIVQDVLGKLPRWTDTGARLLDIGPGCGPVPRLLQAAARGTLTWLDAPEMLALLPDAEGTTKLPGRFPDVLPDGAMDVVLSYSVLHYAFASDGGLRFFDAVLGLLAPGGQALLGDIPNASKRRRFFASQQGRAFHRAFTGTDDDPVVTFNALEPGAIDDAALVGLVLRARNAGFDAHLVPQAADLPMANRREDLLVTRP